MIRTFNYPLRPTDAQSAVMRTWLTACQRLYNAGLEERREAYRKQRASISLYKQYAELTELRAADPAYAAIPAWILRSALSRLDEAYRAFFRRVRGGQKPGFPRFRSQDRYESFSFPSWSEMAIPDNVLTIPKLGAVKFHRYRPIPAYAKIKYVCVKRRGENWTLSLTLDIGDVPAKTTLKTSTGVDVGLTHFATLSTGEEISNPRVFHASKDTLAKRQQVLSRKTKGSTSRLRSKELVRRTYERMRNQRLDFARKLACTLLKRFDLVAFEDLDIENMRSNGNLVKAINDVAWGLFIRCLQSKAEEAGKWAIAVNPRGTTIDCSRCGETVPKPVSERMHRCTRCALVLGRDHNAAINILARGLRALEAA